MAESRATVPHVELTADARLSESGPDRLLASVVKACALALREVPRANASYRDGNFELYSRINIGVALASQDAIVVPTLFDADATPLADLAQEIDELTARAAGGQLAAPELAGATFTLWPVRDPDVVSLTPLIVPPQAAALSAGAVREVPVVKDGGVVPGRVMTLTLACDHRILYGGEAARFLRAIAHHLQAG